MKKAVILILAVILLISACASKQEITYEPLSLTYSDISPVLADSSIRHTVYIAPDGTAIGVEEKDSYRHFKDIRFEQLFSVEGAVSVAAGDWHSAVLKNDGTIFTDGTNHFGQCDTESWKEMVGIAAGAFHTVGLKEDGTVLATGDNSYGQCDINSWSNIVAVAAGNRHTVGLKTDGTLIAAGDNTFGQCDVLGLGEITGISAGLNHTVCLKADGTVIAVGCNRNGQCDTSEWENIVSIDGGGAVTVGVSADGSLFAAGAYDNKYRPELFSKVGYAVAGHGNFMVFDNSGEEKSLDHIETAPEDWKDVVAVSGWYDFILGLKADGTVIAAGSNEYGKCDVSHWKDITAISASASFAVGLKKDGTVLFSGYNDGDLQVEDWTDIIQITAGQHIIAGLKKDGTVVATGPSYYNLDEVKNWTDIVKISGYKDLGITGYKRDGSTVNTYRAGEGSSGDNDMQLFTLTDTGITANTIHDITFKMPDRIYIIAPEQ